MTELCSGTLHYLVTELKPPNFNERDTVHQIVLGLQHLHGQNIVHRDLKPHNILYSSAQDGSVVMKLADFGCSRILKKDTSHLTRSELSNGDFRLFGTNGWIAPEILNGGQTYTSKIDIYPLGMIFCFVLNGICHHPFDDDPLNGSETSEEAYKRIVKINKFIQDKKPFKFDLKIRQKMEESADGSYDLVDWMLSRNSVDRPTAEEVLEHKYFSLNRNPQV